MIRLKLRNVVVFLVGICLVMAFTIEAAEFININSATVKELSKIKGIGKSIAKRIVDYRTKNGDFLKIEDITKVKGIGKKTFEKIKPFINVQKTNIKNSNTKD